MLKEIVKWSRVRSRWALKVPVIGHKGRRDNSNVENTVSVSSFIIVYGSAVFDDLHVTVLEQHVEAEASGICSVAMVVCMGGH